MTGEAYFQNFSFKVNDIQSQVKKIQGSICKSRRVHIKAKSFLILNVDRQYYLLLYYFILPYEVSSELPPKTAFTIEALFVFALLTYN